MLAITILSSEIEGLDNGLNSMTLLLKDLISMLCIRKHLDVPIKVAISKSILIKSKMLI